MSSTTTRPARRARPKAPPALPPNYPARLPGVPLSRTELARRLGLHRDSITRLLRDGMSTAVVDWGGSGRAMRFDPWMAARFYLAWTCPGRDPAGAHPWCELCYDVVADARHTGEHHLRYRHSIFENCAVAGDEGCGYDLPAPMPCRPIAMADAAVPKAKGARL